MIQKVYDILKPLKVPIQYILRPDISGSSKIGISYHFLMKATTYTVMAKEWSLAGVYK